MNKVILMGRLSRDAEVRYTAGDNPMAVAGFAIAVDRRVAKGQNPQADFISCVGFGKTGEFFEKFGKKGVKFLIEGHIQTGDYTNKDGQKVYTTDVVVDNVEFAESKKEGNGSNTPKSQPDSDGFMNIPEGAEEEMPFH